MNRTYLTPKLVSLAVILLFVGTGVEVAAEDLSGLSGKVVDLEGNAVLASHLLFDPSNCTTVFWNPIEGIQRL